MAIAAIGTDFDEPFDVHRNFLTQIAFDHALGLYYLADAVDLILAQVLNLLHGLDLGLMENPGGARVADSVDIGQRDINVLIARKVDACNACHSYPLSLTLLVFCSFADHPHYAFAVNDLALVTNFLN